MSCNHLSDEYGVCFECDKYLKGQPMKDDEQYIQIGDTIYELESYFKKGMLAARLGVPYKSNPICKSRYEYGHDQWSYGHTIQCELIE